MRHTVVQPAVSYRANAGAWFGTGVNIPETVGFSEYIFNQQTLLALKSRGNSRLVNQGSIWLNTAFSAECGVLVLLLERGCCKTISMLSLKGWRACHRGSFSASQLLPAASPVVLMGCASWFCNGPDAIFM